MTGDLLNQGISATKIITETIVDLMEKDNGENLESFKRIQGCLHTVVDVLQEAFLDMVRVDSMREQVKTMNGILEEHLSRFQ